MHFLVSLVYSMYNLSKIGLLGVFGLREKLGPLFFVPSHPLQERATIFNASFFFLAHSFLLEFGGLIGCIKYASTVALITVDSVYTVVLIVLVGVVVFFGSCFTLLPLFA